MIGLGQWTAVDFADLDAIESSYHGKRTFRCRPNQDKTIGESNCTTYHGFLERESSVMVANAKNTGR